MAITVRHVESFLDDWAPFSTQMDFDNTGLLIGDPAQTVERIITCLDVTPSVVEEAIAEGADLIVAHHPLIFKKMSRIQPTDEQGQMIYQLIQHNIAVIAAHTNLDAARNGVSYEMARLLNLGEVTFLKANYPLQQKFELRVDADKAPQVWRELQSLEAESMKTHAYTGSDAQSHTLLEGFLDSYHLSHLTSLLTEFEIPQDNLHLISSKTQTSNIGMGAIGSVPEKNGYPLSVFLELVADTFNPKAIKYSGNAEQIHKVAVCGGAGVFLSGEAQKQGAQAFITSDIKYHDFFVEAPEFVLIDIGHYESEIPIAKKLKRELEQSFDGISVDTTSIVTNPVQTFIPQKDSH